MIEATLYRLIVAVRRDKEIAAENFLCLAVGPIRDLRAADHFARIFRQTVAAVQGVVLVVAASRLLPAQVTVAVVAGALALLVWSFGRSVLLLWRAEQVSPVG